MIRKAQNSSRFQRDKTQKYHILFLLAILGIAIFFRFWELADIPPGLYPDEAIHGNQAISIPGKIFYPENNGREGLFINLIALSFSLFGISIWSLKFVSAAIGVLTVLGLYLLTKEILRITNYELRITNNIALLSAFFLAVSFWHVNFSRIAFRAILVPFCLIFLFYFLFRGFRTQKPSNFLLGGIFFGLGFHTYIAYRLSVALIIISLSLWWIFYKREGRQKKYLFHVSCFMLSTIVIALPLGIYFLQNPQDFVSRAAGISIFTQENPIGAFGKSLASHLLMFNFSGDNNWRHNIAGKPVLFWPVGIFFLIGLTAIVFKLMAIAYRLKNEKWGGLVPSLLLSWWFIMLLPGILTIEGIPHALRTIGAQPPTFIFAGIGGYFVWKKLKDFFVFKQNHLTRIALLIFLFILGGTFIFAQYYRYFWLWGKNPEVEEAFSKNYVEIGNFLNSLPKETKKYVIVNQPGVLVKGIPMPSQTVEFIERTKYREPQAIYLLPEDIEKIKIEKNTVIVPMSYDENLLKKLSQRFPNIPIYYVK